MCVLNLETYLHPVSRWVALKATTWSVPISTQTQTSRILGKQFNGQADSGVYTLTHAGSQNLFRSSNGHEVVHLLKFCANHQCDVVLVLRQQLVLPEHCSGSTLGAVGGCKQTCCRSSLPLDFTSLTCVEMESALLLNIAWYQKKLCVVVLSSVQ